MFLEYSIKSYEKISILKCNSCEKIYELFGHKKKFQKDISFCGLECYKNYYRKIDKEVSKIISTENNNIFNSLNKTTIISKNDSDLKMVIYCLINKTNNKKYVGKAEKTAWKRWLRHVRDAYKPDCTTAIGRAILKYNEKNFELFIIDNSLTPGELNQKEKYWIKELNTLVPNGYNLTEGGEGVSGIKQSEETKNKKRQAMKGKQFTEEHKKNISIGSKGIAKRNKGFKHSTETKEKISLKKIGKFTEKQKNWQNIRKEQLKKPILQFTLDNILIKEWKSAKDIEQETGIFATSIGKICKGKGNSAGGFIWKYKSEVIENVQIA